MIGDALVYGGVAVLVVATIAWAAYALNNNRILSHLDRGLRPPLFPWSKPKPTKP